MKTKAHKLNTVLIIVLANLLISSSIFAQAFEKIGYQAVIRDANGNLVTNQTIGMQVSILVGAGTAYIETHTPTTNANGLVSIEVGDGTLVSGIFANIYWEYGDCYIKTDVDPTGGTNYTISGTSQLLSVPYAIYAKSIPSSNYSVGDFVHGGVVFWVDETGQHGLVCAKIDQGIQQRWDAGTWGNTQAKGDGPFSGEMNTSIIIAALVAIGDDGNTYAARLCAELQITEGGKTYGDWYLPSKEELYIMYLNKDIINSTATANGGTSFFNQYWSSTEFNNQRAWVQYFYTGEQYNYEKGSPRLVRAIRAF
ncbi:MAG: DUF1566 domain-containing protein [Bacteroidales bacterium]|nr:DUF1566 domain-containing protein [Bacteroidales bacterium]